MLEAFTRWRIARPLRESRSQGLLARVGAPTLAGTGDADPWSPGPRWPRLSVTGGHTPAPVRSRRGGPRVHAATRTRCQSRLPAMYLPRDFCVFAHEDWARSASEGDT